MSRTVADFITETFQQAGVKRVYGVVGDSLNGFTDSLRRQEQIKWIHMRNEEAAAFAAGAEAHLTGELAVCAGSCGPGNLHLINGLFDAHRSGVPVLALAAHIPGSEIGIDYFQATHPESLFKECSHYVELVSRPEQLPQILERAMRIAIAKRYGELRRIENRFNGSVNQYFLCDRGRFGYGYVNREDRPRQPQLADGPKLSLDEALDKAADLLRGRNIVGIGSPRASLESNYALRELVGAEHFYSGIEAGELDRIRLVLQVLKDSPLPVPNMREIEDHDAIFVLGEDLTQTAARVALSLRQSVKGKAEDMADAKDALARLRESMQPRITTFSNRIQTFPEKLDSKLESFSDRLQTLPGKLNTATRPRSSGSSISSSSGSRSPTTPILPPPQPHSPETGSGQAERYRMRSASCASRRS